MKRNILMTITVALIGAALLLTAVGRSRTSSSTFEFTGRAPGTSAVPGVAAPDVESAAPRRATNVSRTTTMDTFIAAPKAEQAPALAAGTWINSGPLTLDDLRGKVVLVEFWTFGCYNCRNTLPSVKRWDARYREQGLTVIGVHTPETGREKDVAQVRDAVRSLGLDYPIVTDTEFKTWRAYGVEAWPTIVVLDKRGRIRWTHVGEGAYDETEKVIRQLLDEKAGGRS